MNRDHKLKLGHPGVLYWVLRSYLYIHSLSQQIADLRRPIDSFTTRFYVLFGVTGVKCRSAILDQL